MKKRDWLEKTVGSASPEATAKLDKGQRSEDFERMAADPAKQWHEDGFSALISWEKLATESKCAYLASYAAVYGVPYERFAQAVQDALGEREWAAAQQWSLRGQYEGSRILFAEPSPPRLHGEGTMIAKNTDFAEQLAAVRPATRHLVTSILLDQWPNDAAAAGFSIASQQHYEALYYPIRNHEILPAALDEALADGPTLTALARAATSNPHKEVEFYTARDAVLGRPHQGEAAWENYLRAVEEKSPVAPGRAEESEHGDER